MHMRHERNPSAKRAKTTALGNDATCPTLVGTCKSPMHGLCSICRLSRAVAFGAIFAIPMFDPTRLSAWADAAARQLASATRGHVERHQQLGATIEPRRLRVSANRQY